MANTFSIPLFYDLDLRKWTVSAGSITEQKPIVIGQGANIDFNVKFVQSGVVIELTSPTWIFGIKAINDFSGDYLIQTTSATKTGTGSTTNYKFSVTIDSTELRAFLAETEPTNNFCALEIKDTTNGIPTLSALTTTILPDYTISGTTPTSANGTLIVAPGKTATISNTVTLTGTDGSTYNLNLSGDRYLTSSTTSLTIGNGTKSLTVGAGLAYTTQQDIVIAYDSNNHMHATVTSYNSTTGAMVVDVQGKTGSGTYAAWTVNVGGIAAGVIPSGGAAFSALEKQSASDYDVRWSNYTVSDSPGTLIISGTGTALTISGTASVSGANTGDQTSVSGNAGTATSLQTARTLAITGDITWTSPSFNGSANVTAAGTLATVNSNVGSFGSATQVATFTVNGKGLITAAGNTTVTPAVGSITGLGTGVATANLVRPIFATTATAAGTTTLTVTSASTQEFTGATTQTVTMPVVTALVDGWATTFINQSTGNVTLNSSGGNAIGILTGGQSVTLVCRSISADTTAAAWDYVGQQKLVTVQKSAPQISLADNVEVTVTFNTIVDGFVQSCWNTGTSTFTAPETRKYKFRGVVNASCGSAGDLADLYILSYKVGSASTVNLSAATAGVTAALYSYAALAFDFDISLTAGNTVVIRLLPDDGGNGGTFSVQSEGTQLTISKA